jgi:hypothetical protein
MLSEARSVAVWGRHSCLPAATSADRNVRATLEACSPHRSRRYPSIPVDTCRLFRGLEDEDEKALRSPPGSAGPFSWHRTSVSARQSVGKKCVDEAYPTKCGDKVWRQSASVQHPLKPTLNLTLNRHAPPRLLFRELAANLGGLGVLAVWLLCAARGHTA